MSDEFDVVDIPDLDSEEEDELTEEDVVEGADVDDAETPAPMRGFEEPEPETM